MTCLLPHIRWHNTCFRLMALCPLLLARSEGQSQHLKLTETENTRSFLVVSKKGLIVLILSAHEFLERREKISFHQAEWYLFYGVKWFKDQRKRPGTRELERPGNGFLRSSQERRRSGTFFLSFLPAHSHPFCSASRAASMRFWAPIFCMAVDR